MRAAETADVKDSNSSEDTDINFSSISKMTLTDSAVTA